MKQAKREARRWFRQAEDDVRFVEWVWRERKFPDKGCFMSQQAGEKCLKACLYACGERHVLGHSLFEMVVRLSDQHKAFNAIVNEARRLDRFYITSRYPNGLPGGSPFEVYTDEELDEAFNDLKRVFQVSKEFLERMEII
jgi:HEPN domain-containing protein